MKLSIFIFCNARSFDVLEFESKPPGKSCSRTDKLSNLREIIGHLTVLDIIHIDIMI